MDNAEVNPDSATGTSATGGAYACSAADVAADSFTLAVTLDKTLQDLPPGGEVTVAFTGGAGVTPRAIAVRVASASTYEFHVMGSGVFDLVAKADKSVGKYYVDADGALYLAGAETDTKMAVGTVTVV